MTTLADALALLEHIEQLERHVKANPLDGIAWLPGQIAWLSDPGPDPKLFRAGVRSGKSLAACAEVIWRALGEHPFNPGVPKRPVRIAFITTDKQAQGVQIMRLFWELAPKHQIVAETEFSERTGFRGHVPVVQFRNGSSVTWYSANAGPRALQGSEYDYIQIDEPVSEELFHECENRVRNTGGQVGITLTPLHLPVPWLKEACEQGLVTDHHYPLTVANQTSPMTGKIRTTKNGVPWDAKFIADLRARRTGPDSGITLDGEWETRHTGQWFDVFDESRHVTDRFPDAEMEWFIGVDYAEAARELGMCAVLTGVLWVEEEAGGSRVPETWTLDEVSLPGTATMEMLATAILRMLRDRGIGWHELDGVYGDNPVKGRHHVSSNTELGRYVAARLRTGVDSMRPRISSVKEGGGSSGRNKRSKDTRSRWQYNALASNRARIHPRCKVLIRALKEYDYTDKHPLKDITDAWMYGQKDLWGNLRDAPSIRRLIFG